MVHVIVLQPGLGASTDVIGGIFLLETERIPNHNTTSTEISQQPSAWNVRVLNHGIINAQPGNTYFVNMFDDNATNILCKLDGIPIDMKTV
uniref:Plastocyanin-like domain-containing protein n=1 Tax=Heterorhabditis bacteriophora TaxID=37862 RepID=A0A1I7WRL1_HETBA